MEHAKPNLTRTQRRNLTKLARYLWRKRAGKRRFDMNHYCIDSGDHDIEPEYAAKCGTVACAAGHGPAAGIRPFKGESWNRYSSRCLAPVSSDWTAANAEFEWCFSISWNEVDNTPRGAAKRILYMLQFGLPETLRGQLGGTQPLCYLDVKLPN